MKTSPGFKDMLGKPIHNGSVIAKAVVLGRSPMITVRTASVRFGKLYTDDSKVPVRYPERLLVVLE